MRAKIPKTIKEHRYGGFLGGVWSEVNNNDGIVTMVFCGKRGNGKSYAMLEFARLLDRDKNDVCRLKPEDIRLDPVDFFTDLTGDYHRGKVICLDDAGLHMYKSDALSALLKRVSKVLQNIRYKHPIILMSLPYFGQLMKDARDMTDIYIEMHGIDRVKKVSMASIQTLKISPFTGDLYRYNLLQAKRFSHMKFHLPVVHWEPKQYLFNKPPEDVIKGYDAVKKPALDKINAEHLRAIKAQRIEEVGVDKIQKMNFPDSVKYVNEHVKEVIDTNGKMNVAKIMMLVDVAGRQLFSRDSAVNIARLGA